MVNIMLPISIYVLFCIAVGILANSYNRVGFLWFLCSLITTPLLMGIILLVGGKYESKKEISEKKLAYEMKIEAFNMKFRAEYETYSKNKILTNIFNDITIGKMPSELTLDNALLIVK